MPDEKVACTTTSPHLHLLSHIQAQCYLPLQQLHSEDFNKRVCYVMEITTAERIPDMKLWTQQTSGFSPSILATDSQMPIMTLTMVRLATDYTPLLHPLYSTDQIFPDSNPWWVTIPLMQPMGSKSAKFRPQIALISLESPSYRRNDLEMFLNLQRTTIHLFTEHASDHWSTNTRTSLQTYLLRNCEKWEDDPPFICAQDVRFIFPNLKWKQTSVCMVS